MHIVLSILLAAGDGLYKGLEDFLWKAFTKTEDQRADANVTSALYLLLQKVLPQFTLAQVETGLQHIYELLKVPSLQKGLPGSALSNLKELLGSKTKVKTLFSCLNVSEEDLGNREPGGWAENVLYKAIDGFPCCLQNFLSDALRTTEERAEKELTAVTSFLMPLNVLLSQLFYTPQDIVVVQRMYELLHVSFLNDALDDVTRRQLHDAFYYKNRLCNSAFILCSRRSHPSIVSSAILDQMLDDKDFGQSWLEFVISFLPSSMNIKCVSKRFERVIRAALFSFPDFIFTVDPSYRETIKVKLHLASSLDPFTQIYLPEKDPITIISFLSDAYFQIRFMCEGKAFERGGDVWFLVSELGSLLQIVVLRVSVRFNKDFLPEYELGIAIQ